MSELEEAQALRGQISDPSLIQQLDYAIRCFQESEAMDGGVALIAKQSGKVYLDNVKHAFSRYGPNVRILV